MATAYIYESKSWSYIKNMTKANIIMLFLPITLKRQPFKPCFSQIYLKVTYFYYIYTTRSLVQIKIKNKTQLWSPKLS